PLRRPPPRSTLFPTRRSSDLLAANPDYGLLSRWLHTLALGSDAVGGTAFDLESALFSVDLAQVDGRPVFVAGLARAGTTLLMRLDRKSTRLNSSHVKISYAVC